MRAEATAVASNEPDDLFDDGPFGPFVSGTSAHHSALQPGNALHRPKSSRSRQPSRASSSKRPQSHKDGNAAARSVRSGSGRSSASSSSSSSSRSSSSRSTSSSSSSSTSSRSQPRRYPTPPLVHPLYGYGPTMSQFDTDTFANDNASRSDIPPLPTSWPHWRKELYLTIHHPRTLYARILRLIFLAAVVLSVVSIALSTVPSLTAGSRYHRELFFIIDAFATAVFTIEFALHMIVAPTWRDMIGWGYFIDVLAILPTYIELIFLAARNEDIVDGFSGYSGLAILRVLRLVRIVLIFKFFAKSTKLQLLGEAFRNSADGILLLIYIIPLLVVFFASLVYYAEIASCSFSDGLWRYQLPDGQLGDPTAFQSIPDCFWLVIITLTTIGYGDVTPKTVQGKLVMAAVAVTSIFVLAFPLTMISMQYSHVVRLFAQRRRRKAEMRAEARQRAGEAAEEGVVGGEEEGGGGGRRKRRGWGVRFSRFGRRNGEEEEAQRKKMEARKMEQVEKWVLGTDGKGEGQRENEAGPHVAIYIEGVEDVVPKVEMDDGPALQASGDDVDLIGGEYEVKVDEAKLRQEGDEDNVTEYRIDNPVVPDNRRVPRLEETVSEGTLNEGPDSLDIFRQSVHVGPSAPLIVVGPTVFVDQEAMSANDEEYRAADGPLVDDLVHHLESSGTEYNADTSSRDDPADEMTSRVERTMEPGNQDHDHDRTAESENLVALSADPVDIDVRHTEHPGSSLLRKARSQSSLRLSLLERSIVRLRHHRSHDETITRRIQHDSLEILSVRHFRDRQSDKHHDTEQWQPHVPLLHQFLPSDVHQEGDAQNHQQHDEQDGAASAEASREHRHRHHHHHHHSRHHDDQSENGSHAHRHHHEHHHSSHHEEQSEAGSHSHRRHHHRHHHSSSNLDVTDSLSQTSRSHRHHHHRHHHHHHHSRQDSLDRSHGSQALDPTGSETHSQQHNDNEHPRDPNWESTSNAGTHTTITPKQRLRTTFNVMNSLLHMSYPPTTHTPPVDTDAVSTTTATQSVRRVRTRAGVVPDPFRRPTSSTGVQGATIESIELAMATLLAGAEDGSELAFPDVMRIGVRVVGWEHQYVARSQEDVLMLKMAVGSQEQYRFIMKVLAALQ
ncbi:hypothetical protein BJ742DRAFT_913558 [Cladochytrium replicatum]|nr:hypothetical protein BJ742DRAFT_913558 [Cladochytrium replicatum]